MSDQERIADALRNMGFFYRRDDAGKFCTIDDEEILQVTEGTFLRARVELDLACQDLRDEIIKEFGKPVAKTMFALGRFLRWIKGGRQ